MRNAQGQSRQAASAKAPSNEGWPEATAQSHLDAIAELARTGQLTAAELELHEWQRQSDCPPAARVMLAGLLARRDHIDHALAVLQPVKQQSLDTLDDQELRLLIALHVLSEQPRAARQATEQLHAAYGDRPEIQNWLRLMQPPGYDQLTELPDARVQQLTAELAQQPGVISSLVFAQQQKPDPDHIALLRFALARLAPELGESHPHMPSICRAQARLSLLAGDEGEARRWAHRGLKLVPDDEKLALALSEIRDDTEVGPPAREVLATVSQAHPRYPDVRRAWIRREHHDGHQRSARALLAHWLQSEPESPIARALEKELAA
jgi:hypothetical protein